jgi:hypothetical protein
MYSEKTFIFEKRINRRRCSDPLFICTEKQESLFNPSGSFLDCYVYLYEGVEVFVVVPVQ